MNTEEVLFKTLNEIVILAEIHPELSEDQVVTVVDTVTSWFSELPPEVVDRYKAFLKTTINRERKRGAHARASALADQAFALGWDDDDGAGSSERS